MRQGSKLSLHIYLTSLFCLAVGKSFRVAWKKGKEGGRVSQWGLKWSYHGRRISFPDPRVSLLNLFLWRDWKKRFSWPCLQLLRKVVIGVLKVFLSNSCPHTKNCSLSLSFVSKQCLFLYFCPFKRVKRWLSLLMWAAWFVQRFKLWWCSASQGKKTGNKLKWISDTIQAQRFFFSTNAESVMI